MADQHLTCQRRACNYQQSRKAEASNCLSSRRQTLERFIEPGFLGWQWPPSTPPVNPSSIFPMLGPLQSHKRNRSRERTVRGIKPGSRLQSNKYLLPFLSAHCGNRCKMKFSDFWEASQTQLCCCCKQAESQEWLLLPCQGCRICLSIQDLQISNIPVSLHMYQSPPAPQAQEQQIPLPATDKWPSGALGCACLVLKYCKDTVAVAALSGSQNFNSFFCPRLKHQLLFSCDENLSLYLHSAFSRKPVTFSQTFSSTTVS